MALDTVTHSYVRNAMGGSPWNEHGGTARVCACGKNDNQSLRNGSYRKGSAIGSIKFALARTFFETRSWRNCGMLTCKGIALKYLESLGIHAPSRVMENLIRSECVESRK